MVGKLTFFSPQFPTNILSLVLQSFASSQSLIKEKSSNRQLLLLILSRMAKLSRTYMLGKSFSDTHQLRNALVNNFFKENLYKKF